MWINTLAVARVGADLAVDHKMLVESNLSLNLESDLTLESGSKLVVDR